MSRLSYDQKKVRHFFWPAYKSMSLNGMLDTQLMEQRLEMNKSLLSESMIFISWFLKFKAEMMRITVPCSC